MNPSAATILWAMGIAGSIAVLASVYFAWHNISSQSVVLTVAAFVGTAVLLGIQLFLELRSSFTSDLVTAEYTLDLKLPEMASYFYSEGIAGNFRALLEKEVSADLARRNSQAFKSNSPQVLAADMTVTSFLGMLFTYQPDWQIRPIQYAAIYTLGLQSYEKLSADNECTMLSAKEVIARLKSTDNVFGEIPLTVFNSSHICLPPRSDLAVSRRSIRIENPFCTFIILAKEPQHFLFGRPDLIKPGQMRNIYHEKLADKSERFTNMPVPIEIRIDYNALYARHKDMRKIQEWAEGLVRATHDWYEGQESRFFQLKSPLEQVEPQPK